MQNFTHTIEIIDLIKSDISGFNRRCVGCIVLTKDRKILLQKRGEDWRTFPGFIATFGGGIEGDGTAMQALQRELYEELGANVNEAEVVSLGAFTEAISNYSQLIYAYFWHDHLGTITGCYECQPIYFDNVASAIAHPKAMDDVCWMLSKCKELELLS